MVSLIISVVHLFTISAIFVLLFIISILLLTLVLICSSFSSFLRWTFRPIILHLSSFLIYAFKVKYLSKQCFRYIPEILMCFYCDSFQNIFSSPPFFLTNVLEICDVITNSEDFHTIFLILISNLVMLWPQNMLCKISIILNLMRLVLHISTWWLSANVPSVLEKNAYSAIVE